jgi:hypothetical protein
MNNLLVVVLIGAISQMLFFNTSKDLISSPDINKFFRIVIATVIIYGVYNYLSKNTNLTRLLIEAGVVGILTLIIGKISTQLVVDYVKLYNVNSKYTTEIIFITTGILIHLFCEFTGINKWYTINGVAAMT